MSSIMRAEKIISETIQDIVECRRNLSCQDWSYTSPRDIRIGEPTSTPP